MLKALHIANFKAFSAPAARMPIRQLTLVFGPNSGGKSSLIHGLVLGHEALLKKRFDFKRTKLGGNSIDLGGFRQYVHRRRVDRNVVWGAEIDAPEEMRSTFDADRLHVLSSFGLPPGEQRHRGARPRLLSYEAKTEKEQILKMTFREDGRLRLDDMTPGFARGWELFKQELGQEPLGPEIPRDLLESVAFPSNSLAPVLGADILAASDKTSKLSSALRTALLLVPQLIHSSLTAVMRRLSYLGPLRSLPPRHLAFAEHDELDWAAGGGQAWEKMRQNKALRDEINNWLDSDKLLHTRYRIERQQFVSPRTSKRDIAVALQKIEEQLFKNEPDSFDEPDDFEEMDERRGAERWDGDEFAEIIVQELLRNRRGDGDSDLVLIDKNTNTAVSHRDVGIGISQVLPVLVEAYSNQGRLVAIEQPEIHLHPRLQAELADVFINSAVGPRKNTFVLETHSEHMILRILRRIRETTQRRLPEGLVEVRPEHVAVLYVVPDGSGAKIVEIPVTEDGEFGAPWPDGFFPERMKELF